MNKNLATPAFSLGSRILIKTALIVFFIIGIITGMTIKTDKESHLIALPMLMYFTYQSNITIAAITLVFLINDICKIKGKSFLDINSKLGIFCRFVKFMFTVAITVTFLVFFLILVPGQSGLKSSYLWTIQNLSVHLFVPVLALIDYFSFNDYKFDGIKPLVGSIMPLYYLAFAFICYGCKFHIISGSTMPYFFLDFDKNGWFNFKFGDSMSSSQIGVFFWIIFMFIAIILLSYILAWLSRGLNKLIYKDNEIYKNTKNINKFDKGHKFSINNSNKNVNKKATNIINDLDKIMSELENDMEKKQNPNSNLDNSNHNNI